MSDRNQWKSLIDVTPAWLIGGGIFAKLDTYEAIPWAPDGLGLTIDLDYYGNYSGGKVISPLVDKLLTNGILDDTALTRLAQTIINLYGLNWVKQYQTLKFEYNPINNYDMVEHMQTDDNTNYGHKLEHSNDGSVTNQTTTTDTPHLTQTTTPAAVTTNVNNVMAFNSTAYTPVTQSITTPSGQDTTATTGTDTTQTSGSITDNTSYTDTNSGTDYKITTHTLTRSGNIGVTTSQQMIQSERDLWEWYFIRDVVYKDIDKVLTCPIFV